MCDKHPWSQFEDESLIAVIADCEAEIQWTKVEKILKEKYGIKNRSGKQCRERWSNNLDPNCRKREWTEEEDKIIFTYQQKVGNNWSKISKFLVGRSDNTIKNHFYATVRRKLRRFNKTQQIKINKPLKDIINDKALVKILMEIPDKKKQEAGVELRRSSRLLGKESVREKDEEREEEDDEKEEFSDLERLESRGGGSEMLDVGGGVGSDLVEMKSFIWTPNLVVDNGERTRGDLGKILRFPSFTLTGSFQYHSIDK